MTTRPQISAFALTLGIAAASWFITVRAMNGMQMGVAKRRCRVHPPAAFRSTRTGLADKTSAARKVLVLGTHAGDLSGPA
jgi:hypothetical protein